MENLEKALIPYVKKYKKFPAPFIRRILAGLLKSPKLLETPEYKKLYIECLDFLTWYDIKYLDFSKDKNNDEELIATFMNTKSKTYAYETNVIEDYLHFRKQYWI